VDCTKEELQVRYLRKKSRGIYRFPKAEDLDEIDGCSVESILKNPQIGRRGEDLFFPELMDRDI
jgi:hypothetical protein